MVDFTSKERYDLADLVRIVELLRSPGGCPWDQVQTHDSIRRNLLEEAYEACEALDRDDPAMMTEELGDVLLQVVFHAVLEQERGRFGLEDVCDAECKKLVYRHPHVFGGELHDWDEMKKLEKGQRTLSEILDAVARTMPAAWRAGKLQEKMRKHGAAEPTAQELLSQLEAQTAALRRAVESGEDAEPAMGQALFAAAGLAQLLKIDPEQALHGACEDCIERVRQQEADGAEIKKF